MQDTHYMQRCLELAAIGREWVAPNPMVGAVLVDTATGRVLAEGWHQQFGGPHAEVNCFREYDALYGGQERPAHLTLYVSLEPCSHYGKTPPCAKLVIERGINRVVIGCLDPNPAVSGRGVRMLQEAGIEVTIGVLEEECRALNKRFLCLQEKHRPYVILKWAQTADGYIGYRSEDGAACKPLLISNSLTKQLVHQMRAENMAIMVGTNTALMDNPGLRTTRWSGRNPIRVTIDRHGMLPPTLRMMGTGDSEYQSSRGGEKWPIPECIVYHEESWEEILADLANRGIHSLIVEGGATLLNHILQTGLYDEVHIEVSKASFPHQKGIQPIDAPVYPLSSAPTQIIEGNRIYVEKK